MPQSKKSVDIDDRTDQVAKMREAGYIPASEIVERMGITRSTVSRWSANGELVTELVSNHLYVKIDSLVSHIGVTQARIFGFIGADKAPRKKAGGSK